jgi:hypothetical protein
VSGLFLIAFFGLWVWLAFKVSGFVGKRLAGNRWGLLVAAPLFLVLLPLPVADVIVGKWQFDSRCNRYSVQTIDGQHAPNRRVVYERRGADQFAQGTAVEIRIDPVVFRDAETNRVLVSYHKIHDKGGWPVRTLGISQTSSPLLFASACGPRDQDAFKKNFNITVIN